MREVATNLPMGNKEYSTSLMAIVVIGIIVAAYFIGIRDGKSETCSIIEQAFTDGDSVPNTIVRNFSQSYLQEINSKCGF